MEGRVQAVLALLERLLELGPQGGEGVALPAALVQQHDVGDRPRLALVLAGEQLLHQRQARRRQRLQRGDRLVAARVAVVGEVADQRLDHAAGLEAAELLHGEALDHRLRTVGELVQLCQVGAVEATGPPAGGRRGAGCRPRPRRRAAAAARRSRARRASCRAGTGSGRRGRACGRRAARARAAWRTASCAPWRRRARRAAWRRRPDGCGAPWPPAASASLRRKRSVALRVAEPRHDARCSASQAARLVSKSSPAMSSNSVSSAAPLRTCGAQIDDGRQPPARRLGEALARGATAAAPCGASMRDRAVAAPARPRRRAAAARPRSVCADLTRSK